MTAERQAQPAMRIGQPKWGTASGASRPHHERGASLIGSLMALALFSFGAIGASQLHVAMQHQVTASLQRGTALRLAQSALESLRRPAAVGTSRPAPALHASVARAINGHTDFSVRQTQAASTVPGLTSATVEIRWQGPQGEPQQLALSSLHAAAHDRWSPALLGRLPPALPPYD